MNVNRGACGAWGQGEFRVVGSRIGHYEITAEIGRGGMGEVYRARDTKLNRDVGLRILPQVFAQDSERTARFVRGISKNLSGTEAFAESYRC